MEAGIDEARASEAGEADTNAALTRRSATFVGIRSSTPGSRAGESFNAVLLGAEHARNLSSRELSTGATDTIFAREVRSYLTERSTLRVEVARECHCRLHVFEDNQKDNLSRQRQPQRNRTDSLAFRRLCCERCFRPRAYKCSFVLSCAVDHSAHELISCACRRCLRPPHLQQQPRTALPPARCQR